MQTLGCACNAQDLSPAAYVHALAQGDLRRHFQRQLNVRAFRYRHVGEQKCAPGANILGAAERLGTVRDVTQRNRQVKGEALSYTPFKSNWSGAHG
jgi:hypothetical protein